MAKVMVKKQVETETEIEIDFPVCVKNSHAVYNILSPEKCIKVSNDSGLDSMYAYSIEVNKGYTGFIALILSTGTIVPQEDFMIEFDKALSHINHAAFMLETEPATDEDMRESCEDTTYDEMVGELAKLD